MQVARLVNPGLLSHHRKEPTSSKGDKGTISQATTAREEQWGTQERWT